MRLPFQQIKAEEDKSFSGTHHRHQHRHLPSSITLTNPQHAFALILAGKKIRPCEGRLLWADP